MASGEREQVPSSPRDSALAHDFCPAGDHHDGPDLSWCTRRGGSCRGRHGGGALPGRHHVRARRRDGDDADAVEAERSARSVDGRISRRRAPRPVVGGAVLPALLGVALACRERFHRHGPAGGDRASIGRDDARAAVGHGALPRIRRAAKSFRRAGETTVDSPRGGAGRCLQRRVGRSAHLRMVGPAGARPRRRRPCHGAHQPLHVRRAPWRGDPSQATATLQPPHRSALPRPLRE